MPGPGVNVYITSSPAPEIVPTDTGKGFVPSILERGVQGEAIICHTIAEVKIKCGGEIPQAPFIRSAEAFFQEGGSTLIVGRAEGAGAASASVELGGSGATKVVKVTAASVGAWGNNITVQVKAGEGANVKLAVAENGLAVEESPELNSQEALVQWGKTSNYIRVIPIISELLPGVHVAQALTGGTSNYAAVNTASYEAALATFRAEYGCGQVAAWGVTTTGVKQAIMAHGETYNRTVVPDSRNILSGETVAQYEAALLAEASALRAVAGSRRSATYGPWAEIPGSAPSLPTRVVPYAAIQMGIFARNDGRKQPPPVNEPSAGVNGVPRYAIGLVVEFHRTEREVLNNGGVNVARVMPNRSIETYGNRTLVQPLVEPAWVEVSAARLFMYVYEEGTEILERFVFGQLDPHRQLIERAGGELTAFLESLGNMLYNNAREAVNVGPSVNTEETIRKKELNAIIAVKPSPIAETVNLYLNAQAV